MILELHVALLRTFFFSLCSLLSYTEQYIEYDPFITSPELSNPWISDDNSLWELEARCVRMCNKIQHLAAEKKYSLLDDITSKRRLRASIPASRFLCQMF